MDNSGTKTQNAAPSVLASRRIVVTRGGLAGELLVRRLESYGASVVHCPTIAFAPPDDLAEFQRALKTVMDEDWIVFTSANAVQAVAQQLFEVFSTYDLPLPAIAVVGPATAAAVESLGWRVYFMPKQGTGAALGAQLPLKFGSKVFLPRADIATPELPAALRARDFVVTEAVAYRTLTNPSLANAELLRGGNVDALTFTSPSTVTGFMQAASEAGWDAVAAQRSGKLAVVCIGDTTATAAREHNLVADVIAAQPSIDSMIEALTSCFQNMHNSAPFNSPVSGNS